MLGLFGPTTKVPFYFSLYFTVVSINQFIFRDILEKRLRLIAVKSSRFITYVELILIIKGEFLIQNSFL